MHRYGYLLYWSDLISRISICFSSSLSVVPSWRGRNDEAGEYDIVFIIKARGIGRHSARLGTVRKDFRTFFFRYLAIFDPHLDFFKVVDLEISCLGSRSKRP